MNPYRHERTTIIPRHFEEYVKIICLRITHRYVLCFMFNLNMFNCTMYVHVILCIMYVPEYLKIGIVKEINYARCSVFYVNEMKLIKNLKREFCSF